MNPTREFKIRMVDGEEPADLILPRLDQIDTDSVAVIALHRINRRFPIGHPDDFIHEDETRERVHLDDWDSFCAVFRHARKFLGDNAFFGALNAMTLSPDDIWWSR